jgi:hypothetical protein
MHYAHIAKGAVFGLIVVAPLQRPHRPIPRRGHQRSAHMDRPRLWHPLADSAARPALRLLPHHFLHRYVISHHPRDTGVPRAEILRVSELLATKLVENKFTAYLDLQALMAPGNALSPRGFTITSYTLCGFANLGSLGIQIGVLSALAPSRTRLSARIGPSAMICGFISTLQAAGIAGVNIAFVLLNAD